ncbi:hypothetical protein PFUGPA_02387 [Plasmodium falciparum Palo Alto/Uganda]|uniref:Uncharacterized protein n=1 Tax=Plasmodium falciparum (isolate Palo Alto / Uganda) TaxID=57270 RepID=W4J1Y6_PLAFP|nr:hypothetical protein PFUGPA_02387 [Plasmodium falciparum Palo Alto/Uganda]
MLINEKEEWMKKYENIELEYGALKKKFEEFSIDYKNKNEEIKNFATIKKDMILRYAYMKNENEFLKTQLNILILEKEEEGIKKRELIEINEKQKREIDGYKKIFEEVKSYSISIKRKNEETEKKICTLVDYDISLKKDNILLNEVIKTSEKLNNINNNVNKLLQVEIDDTKKRLDMANKKIEDFYQSFNILKNNYLKYKQDNDKKMMLLIQCNDDLKKELEEKKNIQMYNDQCKIRMDDFNRSTILLEYYEIKNKVNNVNKTILWNKINMLYCHLYDERRKDKNDEINIFIENRKVDSNDATNKQPNNKNDIYKNDIYKNDIYNDIYKNDIYNDNYNNRSENNNFHALIDQLKNKILKEETNEDIHNLFFYNLSLDDYKKEIKNIQMYYEEHKYVEENIDILIIQNNFHISYILKVLNFNIKIMNDIIDCYNISQILLKYIYNTYLEKTIEHIYNYMSIDVIQEKCSIRFGVFFFITLSNFLLCIIIYMKLIRNLGQGTYLKLIENEEIIQLFCFSKYILEKYMDKIKMKLFSSNTDYITLYMISHRLKELYNSVYCSNIIKNKNNTNDKVINNNNVSLHMKYTNDDTFKNNTIHNIDNKNITSLELFCFLNFTLATSILLIIDTDIILECACDVDLQIQIVKKCKDMIKTIKVPKKITNLSNIPLNKYKMSFKNYIEHITNFQQVVTQNINPMEDIIKREKISIEYINNLSTQILNELNIIVGECCTMYSINIHDEQNKDKNKCDLYPLQICDIYIKIYNKIVSIKNKNIIQKTDIVQKDDIIKNLKNEIVLLQNKIKSIKNKMNALIIKEEKSNKINMDLDILKKEKEEYIQIINNLRKIQNNNNNEISYITKQYNDTKNKYLELLKNSESKKKKKYLNNNKNIDEYPNIDNIYYMKKVINNLYYENFLNKINKYYYLYDQMDDYYYHNYDKEYTNIKGGITNKIKKKKKDTSKEESNDIDVMDRKKDIDRKEDIFRIDVNGSIDSFGCSTWNNNFFHINNIHNYTFEGFIRNNLINQQFYNQCEDNILFDDIYNCEVIKNRLSQNKKEYFKNKIFQYTFTNTYEFNDINNKNIHILDIIERYKKLKNEILIEILNTSNDDQIMSIKQSNLYKKKKKNYIHLYHKITELKEMIKQYYHNYNITLFNQNNDSLNKIMNITIEQNVENEEKDDVSNSLGNDNEMKSYDKYKGEDKNYNDEQTLQINKNKSLTKSHIREDKIILGDDSLGHLIQNIFNI